MPSIHLLSSELINQIAAGEVVERPASVVKELVENALDADATEIVIEISRGGLELISVRDNGSGMDPRDARLAVQRHATSKLSAHEDLFSLRSYGFRGEALSSISEVSRFELLTRTKENESAFCLCNVNGEFVESQKGASIGTAISVRNLFYNVPARQKFLKGAFTEFSHIVKIVSDFVLAGEGVSFRLNHNGKNILQVDAADVLEARIAKILGSEASKTMMAFSGNLGDIRVMGSVSHPQYSGAGKKEMRLFVNGRPVTDRVMAKAISDAYDGMLVKGRYPMAVVLLSLPAGEVDVNVHPRKVEVRFVKPQEVYQAVRNVIGSTLRGKFFSVQQSSSESSLDDGKKRPSFSAKDILSLYANRSGRQVLHAASSRQGWNGTSSGGVHFPTMRSKNQPESVADAPVQRQVFLNDVSETSVQQSWRFLGALENRFLVAAKDTSVFLFDQHALSEGILYQKLLESLEKNILIRQPLLVPQVLEFSPTETELLSVHRELFSELGFVFERFGEASIALSEVPSDLAGADMKTLFAEFVLSLSSDISDTKEKTDQLRKKILQTAACKAAYCFGDTIQAEIVERMLAQRDLYSVTSCAHGRPVGWEIVYSEIEKKVARC